MRKFFFLLVLLSLAALACGQYTATATPAAEKSTAIPATATTTPVAAQKAGVTATLTATPACAVVMALKSLNLRVSASEDSEADPQGLNRGDELEILRRVPGWLYVQVDDGRRGYVRAAYVVECEK